MGIHCRRQCLDRVGHADIARENAEPLASTRECRSLAQSILTAADQRHAPAFGRQFQGHSPPDAGAGAGYDRKR